jgi:Protein of unknown function (DUF3168)
MPTASFALQKAIHTALTSNSALLALRGGPRVYDHVPRGAVFPFVTFAHSTERDWSTGTELAHEHIVTLHVWSRAAGSKEAQEIVGAVRAALHDQALALTSHRLVNLRHEFSEVRRVADGETYHGLVRLRAVTEPAG